MVRRPQAWPYADRPRIRLRSSPGPQRDQPTDNRRTRQRPEITAVEGVPDASHAQEDLVRGGTAAPVPGGKIGAGGRGGGVLGEDGIADNDPAGIGADATTTDSPDPLHQRDRRRQITALRGKAARRLRRRYQDEIAGSDGNRRDNAVE